MDSFEQFFRNVEKMIGFFLDQESNADFHRFEPGYTATCCLEDFGTGRSVFPYFDESIDDIINLNSRLDEYIDIRGSKSGLPQVYVYLDGFKGLKIPDIDKKFMISEKYPRYMIEKCFRQIRPFMNAIASHIPKEGKFIFLDKKTKFAVFDENEFYEAGIVYKNGKYDPVIRVVPVNNKTIDLENYSQGSQILLKDLPTATGGGNYHWTPQYFATLLLGGFIRDPFPDFDTITLGKSRFGTRASNIIFTGYNYDNGIRRDLTQHTTDYPIINVESGLLREFGELSDGCWKDGIRKLSGIFGVHDKNVVNLSMSKMPLEGVVGINDKENVCIVYDSELGYHILAGIKFEGDQDLYSDDDPGRLSVIPISDQPFPLHKFRRIGKEDRYDLPEIIGGGDVNKNGKYLLGILITGLMDKKLFHDEEGKPTNVIDLGQPMFKSSSCYLPHSHYTRIA